MTCQRFRGRQETNLYLYTAGMYTHIQLLLAFLVTAWLSFIFSDTVTRSGMFCAMATIIDRCKTEGVVDVFQVVKALRVQKPGVVPTLVSNCQVP